MRHPILLALSILPLACNLPACASETPAPATPAADGSVAAAPARTQTPMPLRAEPVDGQPATQGFYEAGWGVWMHYLDHSLLNGYQPWGKDFQTRITPEGCLALSRDPAKLRIAAAEWNKIVDGFDVKGLVRQLKEVRAGYLVFTMGQVGGFYCSPNPTLDAITEKVAPGVSFCSRRDLIGELADALARERIPLIVYIPANMGLWSPVHTQAFGAKGDTRIAAANPEAYVKWESVLADWSRRFGKKAGGWWIDNPFGISSYAGRTQAPTWGSLATALRAGNPHAIVSLAEYPFQPGSKWPVSDYGSGERNPGTGQFTCGGRWLRGVQWFSESGLYAFSVRTRTFSDKPVLAGEPAGRETRAIIANGGVCAWDVSYNLDGTIPPSYFETLKAIGQSVDATPILRAYTEKSSDPSHPAFRQLVLDIHRPAKDWTIRYTTDGSEPAPSSPRYTQPIPASTRADLPVKARIFDGDHALGETVSRTLPFSSLADAKITASASDPGYPPDLATDGDAEDLESSWRAQPCPQWWQAELPQAKKLKDIRVRPYWGGNRSYRYTVEISVDGKTWDKIGDLSQNTKPSTPAGDVFGFSPRDVRFIRVNMLRHSLNDGVHIVEVGVTPAD